jgi:hypothetical protein
MLWKKPPTTKNRVRGGGVQQNFEWGFFGEQGGRKTFNI